MKSWTWALVPIALLCSAQGQAETRYVTLFDQTVAGDASSAVSVEAALAQRLLERGVVLVDEAQSRKVRALTSAKALIEGRIPQTITSLDADVVVAGIAHAAPAPVPKLAAGRASRFEVDLTVRLIAVDSAQIIDTFTASYGAVDTTARGALRRALEQAGQRAAERVLEAGPGVTTAELTVDGFSRITEVRSLAAALTAMPEVDAVTVVHGGLQRSEYQVRLAPGFDVDSLVGAIEARPELSIRIEGYSQRKLRARHQTRKQTKRGASVAPRVVRVSVDELFPGRAHAYRHEGAGTVTLENPGRRALRGFVMRARVLGLGGPNTEVAVPDIPPGARVQVPLKLTLDPEALEDHRARRDTTVVVDVARGGVSVRRTQAVTVVPRNALSWKAPDSVAAFVVADEHVRAAAQAALSSLPAERRHEPTAKMVALYALLSHLRYQPDAVFPGRAEDLDEVRLPAETLSLGYGDCDDLSVLLAALAEAAGMRAALLLTPGHVLVGLDSGIPSQAAALAEAGHLVRDGRAWVPLEVTRLDASFAEAQRLGALALETARGPDAVELVDVRRAWRAYPPVSWAPELERADRVARVDRATLRGALAEMDGVRREARERAEAALTEGPPSPARLNRLALSMMAGGEVEAAIARLEQAVALPGAGIEVENNLANARLAHGDLEAARELYQRAIERAPKRLEVRLNAAVAARMAKDSAAFAEHLTECLEGPGGEALVQRFVRSINGFEALRGATSAQLTTLSLAADIRRLASRAGFEFEAPEVRASRAQDIPVARIVFWLDSPRS